MIKIVIQSTEEEITPSQEGDIEAYLEDILGQQGHSEFDIYFE